MSFTPVDRTENIKNNLRDKGTLYNFKKNVPNKD